MASINKLSLRGVRSFSPIDEEQTIDFHFPCTMILGKNGCGKTTIIEALKYVITGAFPPGCGRGGNAFVHDPKSIGSSSVKAVVKLRFTSRAGTPIVVVRSMELLQKKTTQTFRQLDGVLKMNDPDTGERISVTHKCGELDKQVPMTLGVSKAILEHVLFCHQEESSWPLMEGAVLKKRFDDIFDSTKYSKALKAFREAEKNYTLRAKDLKAECASLASHRHAAQGFQEELRTQTEQVDILTEQKREIDNEVSKIDKRMEELADLIGQVDTVNFQIDEKQNEVDREHVAIGRQKSMLEVDMTKNGLEPLQMQLRDFDQNVQVDVNKKNALEERAQKLESEIEELRKSEGDLKQRHGMLLEKKESYDSKLRNRCKLMERIARVHKLDLTQLSQSQTNASIIATLSQSMTMDDDDDMSFADITLPTINAEDMQGFYKSLSNKEEELTAKLDTKKKDAHEDRQRLNSAVTDVTAQLQGIDRDKERLVTERRNIEEELQTLRDAKPSSRLRKSDVEEHRKRAREAVKERDELNNDPRRNEIQAEIRQIEEKMEKLKRKIDDDSVILERLKSSEQAQNAVTTLQDQITKEIESLDDVVREETVFLEKHGFSVPEISNRDADQIHVALEELRKQISDKLDEATGSHKQIAEKLSSANTLMSEKTTLFAASQKTISSLRNKLQRLSNVSDNWKALIDKLESHEQEMTKHGYDGNDADVETMIQYVEGRLVRAQNDIKDVMDKKSAERHVKKLTKWIKKQMVTEDKKRCPCCHQEANDEALGHFLEEFYREGQKLLYVPSDALSASQSMASFYGDVLKKADELKGGLREMQRIQLEMTEAEKDAKRLQSEMSQHSEAKRIIETEMSAQDSLLREIRSLSETVRRWLDDAGRIVEKRAEIHQKKLDLSAEAGTDHVKDLRTVDREIIEMREEKDNFAAKINRLNKETTEINRRVTELSSKASRLEAMAAEKAEKFAGDAKALERKKELQIRVQAIGEEERKLSESAVSVKQKLKRKKDDLSKSTSHSDSELEVLLKCIQDFQADKRSLETIDESVREYEESRQLGDLNEMSSKMESIQGQTSEAKKKLEELQPALVEIRKAVDDRERHKRQLQQNIDILVAESRIGALNLEIDQLQKEKDSIDGAQSAEDEHKALRTQKDGLLQKKARSDGMFSSHMEQIRALKRKLATPEYKNVEEQYRHARINHTTTKLAAEDLKKYGNALDKALLKFHGVKIAEINKIIRDLWNLTYKGNDITNIAIRSGQEPGSKAAKSYNYRVVMTKNGTEMDMRGRCSAGQRVLTCIVIRLALAETFGTDCGCIALDEPTVNLDESNKAGLAIALASIIASRSRQKNFQLVLITHDDDFIIQMKTELASMAGVSMPEKYYEVVREEAADGKLYSKIFAKDWESLV